MPLQRQWFVYFGDEFPGFRGVLVREGDQLMLITSRERIQAPSHLTASGDLIPCKSEMDALQQVARRFAKKTRPKG